MGEGAFTEDLADPVALSNILILDLSPILLPMVSARQLAVATSVLIFCGSLALGFLFVSLLIPLSRSIGNSGNASF